jgi:hypothetical protein
MPHATIKLKPGLETNTTPTLNEAAYSSSQLIRFLPERNGLGLAQKLGGWVAYFNTAIGSIVRALKGWSDINAVNHLGIGAESSLNVLTGNNLINITPQTTITNQTAKFSTTINTTTVNVVDYGLIASVLDYVNYVTPVSVGGIILNGPYLLQSASVAVTATTTAASGTGTTATLTFSTAAEKAPVGSTIVVSGVTPTGYNGTWVVTASSTTSVSFANTTTGAQTVAGTVKYGTNYSINAKTAATSTVTNGGASYTFTTTSGSNIVTGTLNDNGYYSGYEFYVGVPVTVGGVTISGVYNVLTTPTTNTFTFAAATVATSSAGPTAINGGLINSNFYIALGPQPSTTGFGVGGFGVSGFGVGSVQPSFSGTPITTTDWTLDNFGSYLIACPAGGTIYEYDPNGQLQTAQYIGGNCPLVNSGIFVAMPQRQIVAYGSSFTSSPDPMLVRWSDVTDFTVWNAAVTNQAGSYRISTGSKIVAGVQAAQQGLLWTDLDMWAMQYIGPPFVYGFNKVASNCGAISRHCVGQLNGVVYWMSQKQFFMSSGTGSQSIPCPIWDVIFQNINTTYLYKVCCGVNSQFNEITWYYPSATATENDSYAKYNTILQQWDFGTLGRTAWIDQSVLGSPIGAGSDTYLYQHEVGNDAANGNQTTAMLSSFQTGYFQLNEADNIVFVDQIWPDMKWGTYSGNKNATVYLTIYYTNYSVDALSSAGSYTGSPSGLISSATFPMTQATEYISCRIRARFMAFSLSSQDVGTFWRLGGIKYRYQLDGRY